MKICIYWKTKDWPLIRSIRGILGLPQQMTVNGETYGEVDDKGLSLAKNYEKDGILTIRHKTQP